MKTIVGALIATAFPLVLLAQPSAPSAFTASTLSTTSVLLSWTDNSTNETGFQVERSTSPTSGFALVTTVAANATTYINTGLPNNTQYYYRVRSTNASGQSAYTPVSAATTGLRRFLLDFGAPKTLSGWNVIGVPTTGSTTNLNDVTGASSSLSLTIVKDPGNGYGQYSSNGAPQAVLDYPQSAASDGHYGWQGGGSYRINGLDNSKVYNIRIFSSRMYVGDARIGIFTINGQSLSIDATNNTTKTIQFVNLVPANGTININFTLQSGVAFGYLNVMDIVEGSNTPVTPPIAPTSFTALATAPTQVKLAWTDVADETGFQIERSTGSSFNVIANVAANTIAFTDNSLAENTHYYYRISASNTGGSSGYATADVTTPVSIPAMPTNLVATAASTSAINLSWNDVSNNETGFEIERLSGGEFELIATTGPNIKTYSDEGLLSSTSYSYRVRSKNSAGSSAYTTQATATTLTPPPAAPTDLAATAASAKQVDLAWTDNSDNETGFRIERSAGGSFTLVTTVGANIVSYSDAALSAVTEYSYRVSAFNTGGGSSFTNTATATTLDSEPASPSLLAASPVSSSEVALSWNDGSTNEAGFEIERSAGDGFVFLATVDANIREFSDAGLTPNTTYLYRVKAVNAIGSSAFSNEATATTLPLPPSAPYDLSAVAVVWSKIDLAWNDSSDNETGFVVERSNGGVFVPIKTLGANASTFSDNTVAANTVYSYRVKATNEGGSSEYSNETTATTPIAPPGAPSSLAATSGSPTQVTLTWVDASQNETGFEIDRLNGAAFELLTTVAANTTTFSDNNLTASTSYTYRIRSINAAGSSAYTSQVTITTQSLTQPYGTIFSESEFSSTSRFSIMGSGITRGTNKLTMTGNPTLFESYVLHNDAASPFRYTCLENWKMRARVKTPSTLNGTSYGVGLGVRSTNTADPYSSSMRWSWDSGQNFIYLYYKTSISMQIVSTTKYTPQPNTYYWVEVTRAKDAFTYKIYDGATGATQLFSVTLTFPTFTSGNYIKAHNTGQFVLYQFGGSNEVTNWEVSTTALKGADYAAIGDSNMHGMFATNNAQRWVENAMTASGKTFNILAGISDRASDVLQRVPEVIALKPKSVILSIGRNDLANGVSLSTVQSNINSIIGQLEAAGITVKLAGVIASNTNVSSLQNFYNAKSNQQVNAYTATKASSSAALNTAYGSGDLIHLNAAGNTVLSNLLQTILGPATPQTPTPPDAPSSLSATAVSASQINLSWTDGSNNETGFIVERSATSGSGFGSIATLGANVTSYSDAGLTNATKYYYRIKATNSVGSSAYSNESNATTSANAADPTALSASTLSASSIVLNWTDNSSNETGFQIERSTSATTGFTLAGTVSANATSYISTGLASGTQYFYRVRATNSGGTSAYSAVSSASTGVKRYLLDFGAPTVLTSAAGWNNISAPTTGSVTNLVDATGATSPVTFTIVKDPSNGYAANNTNGPTQTILDYPSSAVSDSHFGWQSGGSYRINGLDNTKVYHIRIFSSRLYVGDSRMGSFTVNGRSLSLEAAGNTNRTIQFTNLVPSSGALTITFTVASGASFAYLNVMDIVEATPEAGARMASDDIGTEEEMFEPSFEVYPNPANSELTVFVKSVTQQPASIQFFDLTGRELSRIEGETNRHHVFDVSPFARGMYLVRIKTPEKIYSKTFLRQD